LIRINEDYLKKLEKCGSGSFGVVYKVNDKTAYKIYEETTRVCNMHVLVNPIMKYNKVKLNRLINLDKKIIKTDLVQDVIFVNNKFKGVKIKYYDGKLLNRLMEEDYSIKKEVANQLYNNAMELNENYIYPTDYKLNNIMYVDDSVKIIDLDDRYTKVYKLYNKRLEKEVCYGLGDSIKTFFNEYDYYNVINRDLPDLITRKKYDHMYDFESIKKYLEDKDESYNYIFIDKDSNFELVKKLAQDKNNRIVYLYKYSMSEKEDKNNILWNYKKNNIDIFDTTEFSKSHLYFCDFNVRDASDLTKEKVLSKKI